MSNPESASVTQWISDLKSGDEEAARRIFDRYFPVLVRVARAKMKGKNGAMNDEEDIALGALKSLCKGAEQGRFSRLSDRRDLWALLLAITGNKVIDSLRWENRAKRGTRAGQSTILRMTAAHEVTWDHLVGDDPTPEFIVAFQEEHDRLMAELPQDNLREIAVAKMEGYTNEEIASQLGIAERSVYRKLNKIKELWRYRLDQQEGCI